jgi:hypothetical protein
VTVDDVLEAALGFVVDDVGHVGSFKMDGTVPR